MELERKVAIISGGGSGIGEGICRRFAEEGASVVVADIDAAKAEAVAQQLVSTGGEAVPFTVDVSLYDQVLALVEFTEKRFGKLDILVTSAGISKFGPPEQLSIDWWRKVIDVNLNGLFYCCHAAAKVMMKQKSGKIINIASLAGLIAIPNNAPYVASKHGVVGLTKALAIDLGAYNINVNCICPQTTLTPLASETRSKDFFSAESYRTPLDRLPVPDDHAKTALFLASSESDYLTGVILPVDGGRVIALRAHDD